MYGLFFPSLLHSTQPPSCHLESANLCLTRLSPGKGGGGGGQSGLAASRTKLVLPSPSAGPQLCPSLCPGCQPEPAELGQVLPPAQQTQAFDRGISTLRNGTCSLLENKAFGMNCFGQRFKGDQSWVFIGRTDAKAETPILWPPHETVDSLEKTLMLGGIGGRRRRG